MSGHAMSGNLVRYIDAQGDVYVAHSPLEIIRMMKRGDWSRPTTPEEWMETVAGRILVIADFEMEYYDATSFLLALAAAQGGHLQLDYRRKKNE